eukprot:403362394
MKTLRKYSHPKWLQEFDIILPKISKDQKCLFSETGPLTLLIQTRLERLFKHKKVDLFALEEDEDEREFLDGMHDLRFRGQNNNCEVAVKKNNFINQVCQRIYNQIQSLQRGHFCKQEIVYPTLKELSYVVRKKKLDSKELVMYKIMIDYHQARLDLQNDISSLKQYQELLIPLAKKFFQNIDDNAFEIIKLEANQVLENLNQKFKIAGDETQNFTFYNNTNFQTSNATSQTSSDTSDPNSSISSPNLSSVSPQQPILNNNLNLQNQVVVQAIQPNLGRHRPFTLPNNLINPFISNTQQNQPGSNQTIQQNLLNLIQMTSPLTSQTQNRQTQNQSIHPPALLTNPFLIRNNLSQGQQGRQNIFALNQQNLQQNFERQNQQQINTISNSIQQELQSYVQLHGVRQDHEQMLKQYKKIFMGRKGVEFQTRQKYLKFYNKQAVKIGNLVTENMEQYL